MAQVEPVGRPGVTEDYVITGDTDVVLRDFFFSFLVIRLKDGVSPDG